jgi:DNA-binding NarL/FixJ family response regulator
LRSYDQWTIVARFDVVDTEWKRSARVPSRDRKTVTANDKPRTAPDQEPGPRRPRPSRVLVVDDHAGVRQGIIRLIATNGDFQVVGEAADGAEALRLVPTLKPDVVVMDVSMPVLDGVTATALLAHLADPPAILLFTAWADQDRIAEAMSAGASGHVLKDALPGELFDALRAALAAPRPTGAGAPNRFGRREQPTATPPAPVDRNAPRRRWQLRLAGGAAAVLAMGTAVAAAGEGRLPSPIQAAARSVGLPTPANRVDDARQALSRLKAALREGDQAAVAAAAVLLRQRLAGLKPSDRATVGASAALWVADQQLKSTGAPASGPTASGGGSAAAPSTTVTAPGATGTAPPTTDDRSGGPSSTIAAGGGPGPSGGGGPGPSGDGSATTTPAGTSPPTTTHSGGSPGGPPSTTSGATVPSRGGPPATAPGATSPAHGGGGPPTTAAGSPGR